MLLYAASFYGKSILVFKNNVLFSFNSTNDYVINRIYSSNVCCTNKIISTCRHIL